MHARIDRVSVLLCAAVLSAAPARGLAQGRPQVTGYQLVTGTPATLFPGAFLANLDAGDLVAGRTRWDHDGDGVFFNETSVGLLWTPADGLRPFEVSEREYFEGIVQIPTEIAANRFVVGNTIHRSTFRVLPFLWAPANGPKALPVPRNWTGAAVAIAEDGSVAAGEIRPGITAATPSVAARWKILGKARPRGRLLQLPSGQPWSAAYDVSADGAVVVGDAGPGETTRQATRWLDGVQQPLAPVGSASAARFASADGALALGTATVGGRNVLVRWLADGSAQVFSPAGANSILELRAANPAATAAVGQLAVSGNPAPFVWTLAEGFAVIPELGRELDYDFSRALDVSDDGDVVVGAFEATAVFEGDPPPLGFVWTRSDGVFVVDDLFVAAGLGDLGVFQVTALSGDGSRLLAIGNPPRTNFDTNSMVVSLQY